MRHLVEVDLGCPAGKTSGPVRQVHDDLGVRRRHGGVGRGARVARHARVRTWVAARSRGSSARAAGSARSARAARRAFARRRSRGRRPNGDVAAPCPGVGAARARCASRAPACAGRGRPAPTGSTLSDFTRARRQHGERADDDRCLHASKCPTKWKGSRNLSPIIILNTRGNRMDPLRRSICEQDGRRVSPMPRRTRPTAP